ncbi:DNA replication ATP-dependent helicase/nuclease DNA2-like [Panonychus citri]|uniref:DNA replication ATP-dependent helicase/nuclease DNA2-like n=1 Tax=Panonychus citri TaxID=50023 RepID=UPI00230822BB|nr:DNA replication ATP-dependent helicase/nuclease DNA2-like [Panonychus citri]XP_053208792.1 DNA replication ATP-dependent helicase/nuclease DNA2-like [Panonychus citri]
MWCPKRRRIDSTESGDGDKGNTIGLGGDEPPIKMRVGSRKSALALIQSRFVIQEIRKSPFDLKRFHRFEIASLEKQLNNRILLLKLNHPATRREYNCQLSGQWALSEITHGDIVHIQCEIFENDTFFIDNQQGFITINPDTLITSTLISSSVFCMRKAWLGEQFKGRGFGNKYMLIGNIVHSLFQKAITACVKPNFDLDKLLQQIAVQRETIRECFVSKITIDQLISEVQVYLPSIMEWIEKYIHKGPSPLEDDLTHRVKVVSVHDIEDNIWCPSFGTKGKIDVTLEVEIHSNTKRNVVLPLELKTGRPSFSCEHIGQISLYSMMMNNRVSGQGDGGLLLYLKEKPRMKLNSIKRPVASALLQKRNELAFYLNRPKTGPTPKDSAHSCGKCEHLLDCCLTLKAFEPQVLSSTHIMANELVPNVLVHLLREDIEFFAHWISLIQLEISENKRLGNDPFFWSESSEVREAKGLGLGALTIHTCGEESVVLRRKCLPGAQPVSLTIYCSDLTGERVAISLDESVTSSVPSNVAFAIGFVEKMDSNEIEVSIERPVKHINNQSIMRIDILKYSQIYSTNYDNILRLMSDDDHTKRLRDLVVHESVARFKSKFNRSIVEIAKKIIRPLNTQQQKAVLKVINTEDYLLIRGTPGSGKTSVIVAIVRMLIEMGRTVLITSHTHAAVDNILYKLLEHKVDFVRVGSNFRIHPSLTDYYMANKTKGINSPEELGNFYSKIKVVASTCLGVNSEPLFAHKKFDYCLIDEASQVLLPTTLGPLFACDKFILVGDEKQLPPVVRNRSAKEGGLESSLFSRLLTKESSSLQLSIQYRMNSEIVTIPSKLFYDGALACGNPQVASAVLPEPKVKVTTGLSWLDQVLSCQLSKSFLFLNTDLIDHDEDAEYSGFIENTIEADLVCFIVQQLVEHIELSYGQIGVISPFQKQVSLIKKKLDNPEIFVNSVDQYQGKEKDCILISCVKFNRDSNLIVSKEEILSDERRVNVAITRASKKCILIGNRSTLKLYEPFSRLFDLLRADQIIELPKKTFSPE